jgi:hypothetical protein
MSVPASANTSNFLPTTIWGYAYIIHVENEIEALNRKIDVSEEESRKGLRVDYPVIDPE